jgi:prepilin-type N-terminal cleavage/methylation domain-containing protein
LIFINTSQVPKKNGSEMGFTLIEVIIAIVILCVAGLSAVSFFYQSSQYSAIGNNKVTAMHLAKLVYKKYDILGFESLKTSWFPSVTPAQGTVTKSIQLTQTEIQDVLPSPTQINAADYQINIDLSYNASNDWQSNVINITITVISEGESSIVTSSIMKKLM